MIATFVIIGQCVVVTPAAIPRHHEPPWQGRVIYRTDDGYGVAPIDRPSITVVVPAKNVASCGPKVAEAK